MLDSLSVFRVVCVSVSFIFPPCVQAAEKDELALVMKQLDQVQASLDRARVVAIPVALAMLCVSRREMMSKFKNAVSARDYHISTLRGALVIMLILLIIAMTGWMLSPRNLTIHNPPDLRSGSSRA